MFEAAGSRLDRRSERIGVLQVVLLPLDCCDLGLFESP